MEENKINIAEGIRPIFITNNEVEQVTENEMENSERVPDNFMRLSLPTLTGITESYLTIFKGL
jgi:hypothetical protein